MNDTIETSLRASGRMLFRAMEESTHLKERCEALDQRVEALLVERAIVEELRREEAVRILALELLVCDLAR